MDTTKDTYNTAIALCNKKDAEYEALFNMIVAQTEGLTNQAVSSSKKMELLTNSEYLLVRLRILLASETMSAKRLRDAPDCPAPLKAVFVKRCATLSEFSVKLNEIRDDINVLSRMAYNLNFTK